MRRFVTDKTGKVVMHISSLDILTKESIEFWKRECGKKLTCSKCGSYLQPGDQKDHFWPHFSDYSCCRKCLEKEGKKAEDGVKCHVRNQIEVNRRSGQVYGWHSIHVRDTTAGRGNGKNLLLGADV